MSDAGKKVDEGWKEQVRREKELADRVAEAGGGTGGGSPKRELPPADLTTLISMLASQALLGLGAYPHPQSGKPEPDLEMARHAIDLLAVLEAKTQGNRTAEETQTLSGMLYRLRMEFVAAGSAGPAEAAGVGPGPAPRPPGAR